MGGTDCSRSWLDRERCLRQHEQGVGQRRRDAASYFLTPIPGLATTTRSAGSPPSGHDTVAEADKGGLDPLFRQRRRVPPPALW
jgi:hypothetical protein